MTIADCKAVPLSTVAAALGMERTPHRRDRIEPCPACSATGGKVRVIDGRRWHCFGCTASGDALDLVSYHLHGRRWDGSSSVPAWYDRQGWTQETPREAWPAPRQGDYPPRREVLDLLSRCSTPTAQTPTHAWLTSRGITSPPRGSVGALHRYALPGWASYWHRSGYLAILPAVTPDGVVRSVRARRVRAGDGPKAVAPTGHTFCSLMLADQATRASLRARDGRPIAVVEGGPAWLAWLQAGHLAVGLVAGSWSDGWAEALRGRDVVVACDDDDAGRKYVAAVVDGVGARVHAGPKDSPA